MDDVSLSTPSAPTAANDSTISPGLRFRRRAPWGEAVTREDIFYATYALLHAPDYRTKFAENLKRELPRLPLDALPLDQAQWAQLVEIGRALGELHVGYESATPYPLVNRDTTPDGMPFSFRVEKMFGRDDKSRARRQFVHRIVGLHCRDVRLPVGLRQRIGLGRRIVSRQNR